MALSHSPAFIVTVPGRRALDVLSRQGREDMLDLIWAAWFASRPEGTKEMLVQGLRGGPEREAGAATATAEARLLLTRLRTVASGDLELMAIVDGLLEGGRTTRVPVRLRRVLEASDDDRARALTRVRAESSVRLPPRSAETMSAVIGYLAGTELDTGGNGIHEVPAARGYCRAVMGSLGLPFDAYMERIRGWL